MRRSKRRRLEASGWKIGTVTEFLDLADDEAAMVEIRLRLGKALRAQRVRRSLTQEQLGRKLGSSQSRIAKMEGGDPSVSIDLLIRSLLALGASNRDLARTISAASLPQAG